MTLVFMGASADGLSQGNNGLPRLTGAGVLSEDEPAAFEVYRLE